MDNTNLVNKTKENKQKKTGLVFDESMIEHRCLWDPNYPERPERFSLPFQRCQDYGLVDRCLIFKPRPATKDELLLQHDDEIIKIVSDSSGMTDEDYLEKLSSNYDSVYFHPRTYDLALLSAGSTIDLVKNVVTGECKNGMAIIRPPGHHAMYNEVCGYCFFNNVAIAAKHALDNLNMKRILIVDWDVHHGQASQYAFYNDPRVLYFSIHRYEHGEFWPNLRESNYDYIGEGQGKGFNINVPLNKIGLGNTEFLSIFHQVLLPVAYEYAPELIIVSAGYDAAIGCFEGLMEVTPACYSHLLSSLMALADGKICVVLEGGYCLKSLSEGVALTLRTLLGDPCPLIENCSAPDSVLVSTILDVISVLRPYWKCLQNRGSYDSALYDDHEWPKHEPVIQYLGVPPKSPFPTRDYYARHTPERFQELDMKIDYLIQSTNLSVAENITGVVYNMEMIRHMNVNDPTHPEKPDRYWSIINKLDELGLLSRCKILEGRKATDDELLLVHSKEYIDILSSIPTTSQSDLLKLQENYNSIYFCPDSYNSAKMAAGCLLQLVDNVMTGIVQNGVAVIRPPGHHAEVGEANGFCLLNNVSIAASYCIKKYNLKRILVLDWDVHHGNGTQHIFENDQRVLYVSLHRYDNGLFFPSSTDADYRNVGKGKGEGYNINIPWSKKPMSDGDYISAFLSIILPISYQFNPEIVLVSAGFDAGQGDLLGGYKVSPECFCHMTQLLSSLANGKIILALEGGYNLKSLGTYVAYCTKILLGDSCPTLNPGIAPSLSAINTINKVISVLKKYWSCFQYQVELPPINENVVPTSTDDLLSDSLATLRVTDEASGVTKEPIALHVVLPFSNCPHTNFIESIPSTGIDTTAACEDCKNEEENWICLTCYKVYCARYINGHMLTHYDNTKHSLALSFADLSVWCYDCDSYVHNLAVVPVKQAAHLHKFGESMPI